MSSVIGNYIPKSVHPVFMAGAEIAVHMQLEVSHLGLPAPPIGLRATVVRSATTWSLYLKLPEGADSVPVVTWLAGLKPQRIEMSGSAMRADLQSPPARWPDWPVEVRVLMMHLQADGQARVLLGGPRMVLESVVHRLRDRHIHLQVDSVVPVDHSRRPMRLLTQAQHEALHAAVDAGYYRVPRPLTLHELAERMSVSTTALSERLRRAEERIITAYVEGGGDVPRAAEPLPPLWTFAMDSLEV